jgi:glycosyltransferase involved in cell wall biosynthesis
MNENYSPLISVITPFFNAEEFLRETVESVIAQEYTNWELILIDDGSIDGSGEIARKFAEKYPEKIFYFAHEGGANKGAAASRNLGLEKARGELAAFLDADDVWLPQKLKSQTEIFKENPSISMLCESTKYWHSWSGAKKRDTEVKVGAPAGRIYEPPQLVKKLYPLGSGAAPCPCSIVVKTSALKKIKGFEESFTGISQVYEDQAFLIKIYLFEKVYISSACNNLYRQRKGSVMSVTKEQKNFLAARYFFLKWLENYLEREKISDPEIEKLMRKAHLPYKYPFTFKVIRRIEFFWRLIAGSLSKLRL